MWDKVHGMPDINWKWGMSHIDNKGFWSHVSERSDLSEDFIRQYAEQLNWYRLSQNEYFIFTEEFADEFKDKIWWKGLSRRPLTEQFIKRFKDYVDWKAISFKKYLSDDFIAKYADYIDWTILCKYRQVSEQFIEKFSKYIDWKMVSINQKLSIDFIKKHWEDVNLVFLVSNYRVPYYYRNKWKKTESDRLKRDLMR